MKTYPIVEITFSPTGGTKKVADQISCYLGNITNTVNLIRHDVSFSDVTVPSDSLAVIAAPVLSFRVSRGNALCHTWCRINAGI